jgi:hypothetical protein
MDLRFRGLHARCTAFDILALDGEDLLKLPLKLRKTRLARLLALWPEGIVVSEFGQGEIQPGLFRDACKIGLEGMISKPPGQHLSQRPVAELDQSQKPKFASDDGWQVCRFHWLLAAAY